MARRVLIADDVATNRIILKVKLAAARYVVDQAESVAALLELVREEVPDLIIAGIDLPGGGIKAICAGLKANPDLAPDLAMIPVVAVLAAENRSRRLTAFAAGADDVLCKPLDEVALLALVRNLIRTRVTAGELTQKQTIAREFGFGEGARGFAGQARIALIPQSREVGFAWRAGLVGQMSEHITLLSPSEALDNTSESNIPDVFVISANLGKARDGLHLVSELRSKLSTRHAVIVVHNPSGDSNLATMALDMGANAVLNGDFDGEELAIRLRQLTARKLEADALRSSLDQQLSLAMTDPLTGLYNRRYAQTYLSRLAKAAASQGQPFTLMVLDLDRFKRVNDRFGHAVGDEVLIEVAARLKASLREVDLVARLGGEEFLVALPDTGHADAARAAERLRRVIGDRPIRSTTRSVDVPVTLSIGVVVSSRGGVKPELIHQMLDRADRALYASKADGRNQITFVQAAA